MTIGDKIKDIRKQKGMTQKELAKRVGISEMSMVNYEKNRRVPTIEIVKRIAEVLGVTSSILMDANTAMTNGDRIRAMSDSEIAILIYDIAERCCCVRCGRCVFCDKRDCNLNIDWIKDWLKLDNGKIGRIDLTNLTEED
jgi:transcriptional regulator with XRE-family HTH domain